MNKIVIIFTFVIFLSGCGSANESRVLLHPSSSHAHELLTYHSFLKDDLLLNEKLLNINNYSLNQFNAYEDKIKMIDELTFQTLVLDEAKTEWTFQTLQLNESLKEIVIIDETTYTINDSSVMVQMGQYYLNHWLNLDSFIVSYKDLVLNENTFKSLINSYSPFLNIERTSLIEQHGQPILQEGNSGGEIYIYNDHALVLNTTTNEVTVVVIPGNRLKTDINSVTDLFDKPVEVIFNEQTSTYFYRYKYEHDLVSVEVSMNDSRVDAIWIEKNR